MGWEHTEKKRGEKIKIFYESLPEGILRGRPSVRWNDQVHKGMREVGLEERSMVETERGLAGG